MCLDCLNLKNLKFSVYNSNLTVDILQILYFIKLSAQVTIHFSKIQRNKKYFDLRQNRSGTNGIRLVGLSMHAFTFWIEALAPIFLVTRGAKQKFKKWWKLKIMSTKQPKNKKSNKKKS